MRGIIIAEAAAQPIFQRAFEGAGIDAAWVETPSEARSAEFLEAGPVDFVLDLSFEASAANANSAMNAESAAPNAAALNAESVASAITASRIAQLATIDTDLVLLNAVTSTLTELAAPAHFARINGWNTFLQRPLAEVVAGPEASLENLFTAWSKSFILLPDNPGMPSARIVSMIINEAFYALGEGVSTREAIDTAMKLGTNYPFGPLEWCDLIGKENILGLLERLEKENPRYTIAPLLKEG